MKTKPFGYLMAACVILLITGCLFPDNSYLMELNRKGKWRQAEAVGLEMLENRRNFKKGELSETYFQVIYALIRQDKGADARELMRELDQFRQNIAPGEEPVWLERELNRLKSEIEKAPYSDPVTEVKELNRSGYWPDAETKAREALENGEELASAAYLELQFGLVYSLARQQKTEEARREAGLLEDYRRKKGTPDDLRWLDAELEKLDI